MYIIHAVLKNPYIQKTLTSLLNSIKDRDPQLHSCQASIDLHLHNPSALAIGSAIAYRALTPDKAIFGLGVSLPLQALLSAVHAPEDKTAMDLGRGECHMQYRGDNFEGKPPPVPRACEKPHCHNRLGDCSQCGCKTGNEEDLAEEVVSFGEDAVENDSDVRE